MASSSLNPVTGAPIFLDGDAPDPAVNPTEVAAYAASVGNHGNGTQAERDAYPYARKGFTWSNNTTGDVDIHTGTAWVPLISGGAVPTISYTSGWADTGDTQARRIGKLVVLNLVVAKTTAIVSAESPLSLPSGFRPAKTVTGSGFVSGANAPVLVGVTIEPSGVMRVYFSGTTSDKQLSASVTFLAI